MVAKTIDTHIKVPLQGTTKTGKTVFAYMRRSTTKKEQSSSLPQQEEGIEHIAKILGIDHTSIIPFTESRSGYENRSRPEWKKMLAEIDKTKETCTILCRDTSRLSRNPTDNLEIANRIFGDNKHKKSIGNIYYLGENFVISEWNEKTNKKHIVDTLHQNYTDSMETKEKCLAGILLKLNMGEFPYAPPHGLYRVNKDGVKRTNRSEKTTLRQNEKIQFVRRAFQMKTEGKTATEICKYLKQYGKINISTKNIIETLIGNTVYKGEYTEKTTGTFFDSLKFYEGKPPIEKELWDRANAKVGKRGHGFGEGQKEHIAKEKLKSENGKALYMYKAKGEYNAYQTEIKGENGKRKTVGIMERNLIKAFLDVAIPKIRSLYFNTWSRTYHKQIKGQEREKELSILRLEKFGETRKENHDDEDWIDEGLKIDLCGGYFDIIVLSVDNLCTFNTLFEIAQGESNGCVKYLTEKFEFGDSISELWAKLYLSLWNLFAIRYEANGEFESREAFITAVLSQIEKEDKTMEKVFKKRPFPAQMEAIKAKHEKEYYIKRSPKFQAIYDNCISILIDMFNHVGVDAIEVIHNIREKEDSIQVYSKDIIKPIFETSPIFAKEKEEKILQGIRKKELEEDKKKLEEQKKTITKNAILGGFTRDETNDALKDIDDQVKTITKQMEELGESTDMEQYLERLPEIVQKLHELASNMLGEADYKDSRDDIKKLIDIVSHELILTNKKELQVKLFEGFENLKLIEKGNGATDRTGTCDLLLRREAF